MERIIGIDLGTTNSCVAIVEGNTPLIISSRGGYKTTPSVIAISESGKRLVGHIAKRQAITNPTHTVSAAKRLIGKRWSSETTQVIREGLSYELSEGPRDDVRILLHGRGYSVPELSSMILLELKLTAEDYLKEPIKKAVITVPAYFNDAQRQATKEAGEIAGLEVLRMINEPTAAALAYGFGKDLNRTIAVYDLGGGTFDFSVLTVSGDVFEVIATAGDTFLGGEDFDECLINELVTDFARDHRVDLRQDKLALQRLKDAAEKTKIELSSTNASEINLPFIISRADGETLHLQRTITRSRLEELTESLVDRTITLCEKVIQEVRVPIDDVILVGGMTRMPLVQDRVKQCFKHSPRKDVHPDEVVALGAAIQATSLLGGESVLLLDVTPMSLGIMISGGIFSPLIPRNTTVPTSMSHIFTTVRDDQDSVHILVLQGERQDATQNELLGEFSLNNIRPAPKGEVEFEVTFEINADGIVSVSAKDLETGREQAITVTASSNMSTEELVKMAHENRDYLLDTRQNERMIELRNRARKTLESMDHIMPRVKTLLSNTEIAEDALHKAEAVIERAKRSLESEDIDRLERINKALSRTLNMFHNVIEKLKR